MVLGLVGLVPEGDPKIPSARFVRGGVQPPFGLVNPWVLIALVKYLVLTHLWFHHKSRHENSKFM